MCSPVHPPSPLPCQQPDVDSPAHQTGKDSARSREPCEGPQIVSRAYTQRHRHRSLNQRLPETETQPDLLVICILYRPRAHGLEIKDAIIFGRGSAYKARGENRLADIGIGAEDLMHAEILE